MPGSPERLSVFWCLSEPGRVDSQANLWGVVRMKLYHFTSPDRVESVRREGLTTGAIPIDFRDGGNVLWHHIWLTASPFLIDQVWATNFTGFAPERTAFRLTVVIPKSHRRLLSYWPEYARQNPRITVKTAKILNASDPYGGAVWYVFRGRIRPAWIRRMVDMRPEMVEAAR